MILSRLNLTNFKNYASAELEFSEKINCFVGDNGSGKTNLLDAIYYLSFCKSAFNLHDTQNIRFEASFFALHGHYLLGEVGEDQISCIQQKNHRKQFKRNKKDYERLAEHIGLLPLVLISPYDSDLVNDGSEIRRKFVDGVISQFDKIYLEDLLSYSKALEQRNRLLKQFSKQGDFDKNLLEIWDEQLVKYGTLLYEKRKLFFEEYMPIFQYYYQWISGENEQVELRYESQLHHASHTELLGKSLEKDRILEYTTTGIHKDDLEFFIEGFPLKKFGSQGQQKSFLVALKLGQFDFTRNKKGFKPLLLLDDIFDKLDDKRVENLIQLTDNGNFGQVFITDTQRQRIEKIFLKIRIEHKIFEVNQGVVKER